MRIKKLLLVVLVVVFSLSFVGCKEKTAFEKYQEIYNHGNYEEADSYIIEWENEIISRNEILQDDEKIADVKFSKKNSITTFCNNIKNKCNDLSTDVVNYLLQSLKNITNGLYNIDDYIKLMDGTFTYEQEKILIENVKDEIDEYVIEYFDNYLNGRKINVEILNYLDDINLETFEIILNKVMIKEYVQTNNAEYDKAIIEYLNKVKKRGFSEEECFKLMTSALVCRDYELYKDLVIQFKNVTTHLEITDGLKSNYEINLKSEVVDDSNRVEAYVQTNKFTFDTANHQILKEIESDCLYIKNLTTNIFKKVTDKKVTMIAPLFEYNFPETHYGCGWIYFVVERNLYMVDCFNDTIFKVYSFTNDLNSYSLNANGHIVSYGIGNKLYVCDWLKGITCEYSTSKKVELTMLGVYDLENNEIIVRCLKGNKSSSFSEIGDVYVVSFGENSIKTLESK